MQGEADEGSYSLFDQSEVAGADQVDVTPEESRPGVQRNAATELDALSATALITGATGLIGSHVAELFREMGWRVRALIRPASNAAFLEELSCQFVLADLTDPEAVRGAAEGCEIVIHAAAQLGTPASMEQHVEVNVEGTRRMLREAIRAGVRRFVHLSSVAVYGAPPRDALPLDEESPLDGPISRDDHYSLTKRMAEDVVRKAGERIEWCILRPDMVMGERDRLFTPGVVRWASRPVLATLGGGLSDLPLVYAGNVARAAWLAGTHGAAAWRTYNVTDDGELIQKTLVRMAAARGADAPVLPLPVPLVSLVGELAGALRRVLPRVRPLALTPNRMRLFTEGDPYCSDLIRNELGWEPVVSTEEGWRRAVEWYRSTGAGGGRRQARDDVF